MVVLGGVVVVLGGVVVVLGGLVVVVDLRDPERLPLLASFWFSVSLVVVLAVVLGVVEDELRRFAARDLVGALGAGGPIKPGRRLLRARGFFLLEDEEVPGLP